MDIEKTIDKALLKLFEIINTKELTEDERAELIDKIMNLRKFNKYAEKLEFKESLKEFWDKVYQLEKWGEER